MPAARPSKASVANVVAALKAAGAAAVEVRVHGDGGFTVREVPVDTPPAPIPSSPPRWGSDR